MKRVLTVATLLTALCCAAGEYVTRNFGTSGISVTNTQQNASWDLSAVAIKFGDTLPEATETVRVSRVSMGVEFLLAETQDIGGTMVLLTPENMAFKLGDSVKVYGGGATGVVQIFTR